MNPRASVGQEQVADAAGTYACVLRTREVASWRPTAGEIPD